MIICRICEMNNSAHRTKIKFRIGTSIQKSKVKEQRLNEKSTFSSHTYQYNQ